MVPDELKASAIDALEVLEQELAVLGVVTDLRREALYPYLWVLPDTVGGMMVFACELDEPPTYVWSTLSRSHLQDDPAGAARRIAGSAQGERSTTHGHRW